jgi:hypothetical protein
MQAELQRLDFKHHTGKSSLTRSDFKACGVGNGASYMTKDDKLVALASFGSTCSAIATQNGWMMVACVELSAIIFATWGAFHYVSHMHLVCCIREQEQTVFL